MKKTFFLLIMLFAYLFTYSQDLNSTDSFDYLIRETEGDLNNDSILDRATISMDTINETRPLRLQVFLSQPNGKSKLVFSTTDIIQAMYPSELNGKHNGSQIPDIYIEKGKMQLDFYIKGNSRYEFLYVNGKFELVYFEYVYWDDINITETKFNLLTGEYTKQSEIQETSEITVEIEKKVILKPLPELKGFKPFQNELF